MAVELLLQTTAQLLQLNGPAGQLLLLLCQQSAALSAVFIFGVFLIQPILGQFIRNVFIPRGHHIFQGNVQPVGTGKDQVPLRNTKGF